MGVDKRSFGFFLFSREGSNKIELFAGMDTKSANGFSKREDIKRFTTLIRVWIAFNANFLEVV